MHHACISAFPSMSQQTGKGRREERGEGEGGQKEELRHVGGVCK